MLGKYVIKLLGPNPTWPAFNKYMIKIKIMYKCMSASYTKPIF